MTATGGLLSGILAVMAAAAAAVGAASGGGPASASGASGSVCPPAGAHLLASDSVGVVYEVPSPGGSRLGGSSAFACQRRSRRRFSLAGSAHTRVGPAALSGAVAAYATTAMGVDTSGSTMTVLRLTDGARHTVESASSPTRPESFTSVTAVVVTPRGSAAWIAARSGIGQPRTTYEVRRYQGGADTLLDSGPTISAGSLRHGGSTVTWTDAGRRRSAALR